MDVKVVEKQVLYDGKKVRLELHHLKDEHGKRLTREVVVHPGAAVILPVLPDGNVMLIRTWRYGVREHLLELPAGTIDPNETAINCAGRELIEETGYVASKLQLLGTFYSSPGILTEKMHAYLATGLMPSGGGLDETEQIELRPTPFAEAMDMVLKNHIQDAKTITTLLLFDAKRKAGH